MLTPKKITFEFIVLRHFELNSMKK